MSLQKEIERKWLVDREKIPFDLSLYEPLVMEQSYISFSPTVRLRNTNDESFVLCVKTKGDKNGLSRDEFETAITKEEYERLLLKTEGTVIKKTRYCVPADNGLVMEFDIFSGKLEGLCYMEIEFETQESALSYPDPEWAIKDVTADVRYKNACLAKMGMPQQIMNNKKQTNEKYFSLVFFYYYSKLYFTTDLENLCGSLRQNIRQSLPILYP